MSEQQQTQPQQPSQFEYQKWAHELKREDAQRAHDQASEFTSIINRAAIENANQALRAAVLINGGAAVSVLAFVGGLAAKGMVAAEALQQVSSALVWFAIGVSAATLAMGFSYLTNYCIAANAGYQLRTWEHPFLTPTPTSKRFQCAAIAFQITAVLLGFGAIGVFVRGMFAVKDSFPHLVH